MEKVIEEFIEQHVQNSLEAFNENKCLIPMFAILTRKQEEHRINLCPIPPELIENQKGKDFVRDKLLERLKSDLKKDGQQLLCVNWSSEAWMYTGKKDEVDIRDYKSLPKKEALILSFDTTDGNVTYQYEIKRDMFVSEDGMDENVHLEFISKSKGDTSSGRFTNLLD